MSYDPHEAYIIVGDFNMKSIMNNQQNYNAKLENFMLTEYNLQQQVTKVTTDYQSKLDLVFTNRTMHIVDVIDNYWSDHKLVYSASPLSPTINS